MKKLVTCTLLVLIVASIVIGIVSAIQEPFGPAENYGDGISDGSGNYDEPWQNTPAPGETPGPAPNAGDGIPDGSGF